MHITVVYVFTVKYSIYTSCPHIHTNVYNYRKNIYISKKVSITDIFDRKKGWKAHVPQPITVGKRMLYYRHLFPSLRLCFRSFLAQILCGKSIHCKQGYAIQKIYVLHRMICLIIVIIKIFIIVFSIILYSGTL